MRIRYLCYPILALIFLTCFFCINDGCARSAGNLPPNFVRVYYFHGNFRCTNCYNIEKYTKEAVEKRFKNELKSGKIVFQVVNVEIKGNEHFMRDYQLYTKSVVLSLLKNGKEVKFDNLTKVWEYLRNKDAFQQYIKAEIEKYLKEL